jgi:hypothetical protein
MSHPLQLRDRKGKLVTGDRLDVAMAAGKRAYEAEQTLLHSVGLLAYDLPGSKGRVREAMWVALDRYDEVHGAPA